MNNNIAVNNDSINKQSSILLDILKEVEVPVDCKESYLNALQALIKLLKASDQEELVKQGTVIFDKVLSSTHKEQKYLDDVAPNSENSKTGILFIGALITGAFGAIGFILSALFGPILKKYGEALSNTTTV